MKNFIESIDGNAKRSISTLLAAGSLMVVAACGPAESESSDPSNQNQCSQSSDGYVDVTGICEQIIYSDGSR